MIPALLLQVIVPKFFVLTGGLVSQQQSSENKPQWKPRPRKAIVVLRSHGWGGHPQ